MKGLSICQRRLIVKHWNKRLKGDADYGAISRAKVGIRELFEQAWQRKGKIGSRTKAARHDGLGRRSMAGADETTSPEGSVDHARRAASKAARSGGKKAPDLRIVSAPGDAVAADWRAVDAPAPRIKTPVPSADLYAEIGIRRKG